MHAFERSSSIQARLWWRTIDSSPIYTKTLAFPKSWAIWTINVLNAFKTIMQSSRQHIYIYIYIYMRYSHQPHRHINTSSMKITTYHENNLNTSSKQCYAYSCLYFISLWDLSWQPQGYPFVYTYSTLWGLPRDSEKLVTHSR
jgi:hypothetical protein